MTALNVGEHGWRRIEPDPTLEAIHACLGHAPSRGLDTVRVRCGWGDEVAHVTVNSDVNGHPFVNVHKERKLKTKTLYRSTGSPDFHTAEDFRRFMQVMEEAGRLAGFLPEQGVTDG